MSASINSGCFTCFYRYQEEFRPGHKAKRCQVSEVLVFQKHVDWILKLFCTNPWSRRYTFFPEQDDVSAIYDLQNFWQTVPSISNNQVHAAQHFPSQLWMTYVWNFETNLPRLHLNDRYPSRKRKVMHFDLDPSWYHISGIDNQCLKGQDAILVAWLREWRLGFSSWTSNGT